MTEQGLQAHRKIAARFCMQLPATHDARLVVGSAALEDLKRPS